MTRILSTAVARPRWRAIVATFALVGALVATGSALPANADVVGTGPGTISGTVTASDGAPLEGAWVSASLPFGQGTGFSVSAPTDSAGHYEFSGLEADTYFVQVYVFGGYQPPPGQNATVTEASPLATVNFVAVPFEVGVGTISGHVLADGIGFANTEVTIYNEVTTEVHWLYTDENGYFAFSGLSNGDWQVNGHLGPDYKPLFGQYAHVTTEAPDATVDLPFLSWAVGTAAITGVVTDAETGEAIPGIYLSAFGLEDSHSFSQTTDESGTFTFDLLPAGNYYLSVGGFGNPGYLQASQEIQVLDSEVVNADQTLIPANAAVSGHVQTKDGAPVVGHYVSAFAEGIGSGGAATDENGDYVITGLGAVAYTLSIGGPGSPYKLKEKVVTPVAHGTVTVNFTLKDRKTGTLSGAPTLANGQWYEKPVCVTLYSSKNKNPIAEVTTWGPEFGDGSFYFDDLKPGSYTVAFEDCDDDPALAFDRVFLGGAAKYKDATFVTIAAAQDRYENYLPLKFRTASSTIVGHVAKPNGTAIAGLTVSASNGTVTASAVTNASGDYTISGLFNGEYTVSAGGAGTLYVHKEKSVTAIEDGSVTANFTLAKN